jgi:hypothetical protein
VNPGGDEGWDGPPLDIDIPDDARELERDVLAYHREQRALRRRRRLRRIMPGQAGIMPLMASILAVCLVAGMMLSVFTITPTDGTSKTHVTTTQPAGPTPDAGKQGPATPGPTASSTGRQTATASAPAQGTQVPGTRESGQQHPSGAPRVSPRG